jgi:hypothetical protein
MFFFVTKDKPLAILLKGERETGGVVYQQKNQSCWDDLVQEKIKWV